MGPTWFEGATIERKDVNGGYEPGNCIWIVAEDQAKNKRTTVLIDTPDGAMRLREASEKFAVPYEVLRIRYSQGKRGAELIAPSQRAKTKSQKRKEP